MLDHINMDNLHSHTFPFSSKIQNSQIRPLKHSIPILKPRLLKSPLNSISRRHSMGVSTEHHKSHWTLHDLPNNVLDSLQRHRIDLLAQFLHGLKFPSLREVLGDLDHPLICVLDAVEAVPQEEGLSSADLLLGDRAPKLREFFQDSL